MIMRYLVAAVVFLGAFTMAHTQAATTIGGPSTGLWARAGDGGRGFNIDLQGNIMTVTTFIYTQTGEPIWYLSSGIFNHATGRFQSSYDSYSNGQCFGCPPNQPIVHSAAAGNMVIQFHSNLTATITTPAGAIDIKKFNYAFGSPTDMLYGLWVGSYFIGGLVGGDWMLFFEPYEDDDGSVYAAGISNGASDSIALGRYAPDLDGVLIITHQDGSSFNHWYLVGMDDRRGTGGGWVLRTNETPTGTGSPAYLGRFLWEPELDTASNAPVEAQSSAELDARLAAKSSCSANCTPLAGAAELLGALNRVVAKRAQAVATP